MGVRILDSATGGGGTTEARVEATRATRFAMVPRVGANYAMSSVTGTIAAALGANSTIYAQRMNPAAGATLAFIERIRVQYTTIVAFTTPITAGRRLALYRGSGAAASGGTALATAAQKDSTGATSQCNSGNGGDTRIATTAALTVTGITYEAQEFRTLTLVHVGAAGGFIEMLWEFHATENAPLILQPGQLIGLRNPAAMDAGGTWQLGINIDWYEGAAYAT
jgi:hypothetical protein